ncbi:hypothetical protein GQ43DRAFT_399247, partial [Delitschia confertaspora ATCC 74209]
MAAAIEIEVQPPDDPKYTLHYMNGMNGVHSCPTCGTDITPAVRDQNAKDNKRRIAELEAQIRILTDKATAAADKLADYEDEILRLRITHTSTTTTSPQNRPSTSSEAARPQTATSTTSKPSRFSFLRRNPSSANITPDDFPTPPLPNQRSSTPDLKAQLEKEQRLRAQAEGKLANMNVEIEELSATLFTQANEMVATERKARAKLEERVKVLEVRDEEKRARLERLEQCCKRIERVRGLLGE